MTELLSRLSHLVNYSSQLIFVSGDSLADQQKTLSHFLSSQQDNTEISFFSVSSNKQATDYRGAICRQLGGHQVGSFVRPLQQLLCDPEEGLEGNRPYLVCITQAEQLEASFLQELWDWVMHSQKGNEGVHLNIILFGESAWAKSSQEWLPIQNSHKPVLLSSQSVDPVGFDVNALEALMADKSSWFSTSNQPLVTNKWFISSVLSVFFVVFIGLMAWQYPAHFKSMLSGEDEWLNQAEAKTSEERLFEGEIQKERQAIVDEDLNDILLTQSTQNNAGKYASQLIVVEAELDESERDGIADEASEYNGSSVTDTLLVSNWADSVASKVDASVPANQSNEALKTSQVIAQIPGTVVNSEGDFQVPDIISVEQLDAQLGNRVQVEMSTELVQNYSSEQNNSLNSQQISLVDDSSIDYQFDETTLLLLPADSIVLQLSGIQNPVVLENYLNNNNLKASTWVYETQRYGGPWYVVLYRQSFDSIDAALNQLSSLPDDVREAQPFAKSIDQIQNEINRR